MSPTHDADRSPHRSAAGLGRYVPFADGARSGCGGPPRGAEKSPPAGMPPWGPPPVFARPSAEAVVAVKDVYGEMETALGPAADACRACGRCCRFREGAIVLFASSLEMAVLMAEAGPPDASRYVVGGPVAGNWVCPYQEGNRCAERAVRPLGCRTYFCDTDAGAQGRAVHAHALDRLRTVAREHGHPWWYGPAKAYLDAVVPGR